MKRKYGLSFCLLFFLLVFSRTSGQTRDTTSTVSIKGEVLHPLVLKASDLAGMKRVQATVKGGEAHNDPVQPFSGVPLSDILEQAGVTMGKQLRGENMTKY